MRPGCGKMRRTENQAKSPVRQPHACLILRTHRSKEEKATAFDPRNMSSPKQFQLVLSMVGTTKARMRCQLFAHRMQYIRRAHV